MYIKIQFTGKSLKVRVFIKGQVQVHIVVTKHYLHTANMKPET